MPLLQSDSPRTYDTRSERLIAGEMGRAYARIMQAAAGLVTVSVHDLDPGGVWRCTQDGPEEAALVMCDVRGGRPRSTRAELAEALIAICVAHGQLARHQVKVEFTQHAGDEMYHLHLGGFNRDRNHEEAPD